MKLTISKVDDKVYRKHKNILGQLPIIYKVNLYYIKYYIDFIMKFLYLVVDKITIRFKFCPVWVIEIRDRIKVTSKRPLYMGTIVILALGGQFNSVLDAYIAKS